MIKKIQGQNRGEKKGGKRRVIKNQIEKRIKGNKKLRREPKIKILAHELLASTLSYLMLALW
jgi:hypothetical protein